MNEPNPPRGLAAGIPIRRAATGSPVRTGR